MADDAAGGLEPGAVVAERYVVLDQLGAGAMGSVHLAHQVWLDRMVALKVLRSGDVVTARARRRLHREARAVARISHPNVVQVYDYGETADARPFLVMERIDGPTARAWASKGPPLADVLAATRAALAGLAAAHAAGVLHRDLKPANMLVREEDPAQLVLVDFGIAAVLRRDEPGDGGDATLDEEAAHLTAPGTVIGTPLYMSPEQALGRPVGPGSDVYAMGVILYEWLYGRPPFEGPVREVMYAHVHRTLPEGPARFELPPELQDVVRRALAKRPEARFQDAAAMGRALARVAGDAPRDELATRPRKAAAPTVPGPRAPAGREPSLPVELPFAARETEFAELSALLPPQGRRGRVVLVRGAVGVGKSRLVREVVEAAARRGALRVGAAVCRRSGAPYAALASALAELDGGDLQLSLGGEGSVTPADLGDALERRARAAVTGGPALLSLDDLQLAGEATFGFLERLARAQLLAPFPLSVIATLDVGEGDVSAGIAHLSRHAGEVVQLLDLPRLGDDRIEELLRAALPLSEETARRLARPCGGSPLLANQLLRHVVRSGVLTASDAGLALPDGALEDLGPAPALEELLRHRLERLRSDPSAGAVLEAAAVLGDRFDVDSLRAVLDVRSEVPGDALDDVLDRLLAEGALIELRGPGDRIRWDSGLLREMVLDAMQGSRRRRRLSAAAARALADVPGSERAVVELFLVAGEAQEAAPYAVVAGEAAVQAGEWSAAQRLLGRALASAPERSLQARALFAMADLDNALGRREAAEQRLEEVLGHAGSAYERARAWFGLGRSRYNRGRPKQAQDDLTTALAVIEGASGRGARRLRNRILRTLAACEAAVGVVGPLEPEPPSVDDGPLERLEYHKTVGATALLRGRFDAAARAFGAAHAEAIEAGADADVPRILCDRGSALRRAGRDAEANRELRAALQSARAVRTRPLEAKILNELGESARSGERWDEARACYEGAVAIWEARGDHHEVLGRLNLALGIAESGAPEDALRALDDIDPHAVAPRWAVPRALTCAFVAACAGAQARADRELAAGLEGLGPARPPEAVAMLRRLRAAPGGGARRLETIDAVLAVAAPAEPSSADGGA